MSRFMRMAGIDAPPTPPPPKREMRDDRVCCGFQPIRTAEGFCCPECGAKRDEPIIDEPPYVEGANIKRRRPPYDRLSHLKDWLANAQGMEAAKMPPELVSRLKERVAKEGWKSPSHEQMRLWLREMNQSRYYEHVPKLHALVTGTPAKAFTSDQIAEITAHFIQVQDIFDSVKPKGRKSFISYSYTLRQLCRLLGYDEWVPRFRLVKSRDLLHEMDAIWRQICGELGWRFLHSF